MAENDTGRIVLPQKLPITALASIVAGSVLLGVAWNGTMNRLQAVEQRVQKIEASTVADDIRKLKDDVSWIRGVLEGRGPEGKK